MTRGEVSGALQALNATNTRDRRAALRKVLAPRMAAPAVERVIADLKSYPEWNARMDLEEGVVTAPAASLPADPAPPKAKAKPKAKRGA